MSDIEERLLNWQKVYPEDFDKPEGHLYVEAAHMIKAMRLDYAKLLACVRYYAYWGVVSPDVDDRILNDGGDYARSTLADTGKES